MSRVGKKPIIVPRGVEVKVKDNEITVKGPKGELSRSLSTDMKIELEDGVITVARPSDDRHHRAMHGFTRSMIANMVDGVSKGFQKKLELYGVGSAILRLPYHGHGPGKALAVVCRNLRRYKTFRVTEQPFCRHFSSSALFFPMR